MLVWKFGLTFKQALIAYEIMQEDWARESTGASVLDKWQLSPVEDKTQNNTKPVNDDVSGRYDTIFV